jgi:hypothetical protein
LVKCLSLIVASCGSGGGGVPKGTGTKQLGVAGAQTYAGGVVVDSGGNVYVTGYTTGGLDGDTLMGLWNFFLTKCNSSGNK